MPPKAPVPATQKLPDPPSPFAKKKEDEPRWQLDIHGNVEAVTAALRGIIALKQPGRSFYAEAVLLMIEHTPTHPNPDMKHVFSVLAEGHRQSLHRLQLGTGVC